MNIGSDKEKLSKFLVWKGMTLWIGEIDFQELH